MIFWRSCTLALIPALFTLQALSAETTTLRGRAIYGVDDRLDYYQVAHTSIAPLFIGSVLLVSKSDFGYGLNLETNTHAQADNLCPEAPFANQPTVGFCSGALITDRLVLTAGHCIHTKHECADTRIVFGYVMLSPTVAKKSFTQDEVYQCTRVVYSHQNDDGRDIALIELDRPVRQHVPLKIQKNFYPTLGLPLAVLGYPDGLPAKIAAGAQIRSMGDGYITADIDAFEGNSGSPVFNWKTGQVIGVLSRGEEDYILDQRRSCNLPKRCNMETCSGEDVTLFGTLAAYLP